MVVQCGRLVRHVCSRRSSKITQNKVIRFILGLPSRSHIGPAEFSGANMLPVPLRVDQLKLNHMYSIINGIAPSYLKSEIAITGHHGHVTRSGNRACFVPRVNSFAIKSFFYTGITGAYAGFLRGGPNFKILGILFKHAAKRHVASSEAASLCAGGLGACPPQENFLKKCNFVRFEGYFQPLSW